MTGNAPGSENPQEILRWAADAFGSQMAVACSFGGPTGMAVIDMMLSIDRSVPIYYLDTGLLFPETYEHIRKVAEYYGIEPIAVKPELSLDEQGAAHGPALWERDPDRCCELRKVEPQRQFLTGYRAWVTGLRRDQSATRDAVTAVEYDQKFDLVKISPLATWTEHQVWEYIHERSIPYNPLNDQGYPSVGCFPCTRAITSGEDPRAGRWTGTSKTECGLHVRVITDESNQPWLKILNQYK